MFEQVLCGRLPDGAGQTQVLVALACTPRHGNAAPALIGYKVHREADLRVPTRFIMYMYM